MPKRKLKAPTEAAGAEPTAICKTELVVTEDMLENPDIKEMDLQVAADVLRSSLSYSDVRAFEESPTRFHNRRLDGAVTSNSRLIREGAPHTTEDLITAELAGLKRTDAIEITALRRKYDPYALLNIIRSLRKYRERVWELERKLNERKEEVTS